LHVLPATQHVGPLKLESPPHCPYLAAHVPDEAVVVVFGGTVEVLVVVGGAVVMIVVFGVVVVAMMVVLVIVGLGAAELELVSVGAAEPDRADCSIGMYGP
jgi:hypothetical protein